MIDINLDPEWLIMLTAMARTGSGGQGAILTRHIHTGQFMTATIDYDTSQTWKVSDMETSAVQTPAIRRFTRMVMRLWTAPDSPPQDGPILLDWAGNPVAAGAEVVLPVYGYPGARSLAEAQSVHAVWVGWQSALRSLPPGHDLVTTLRERFQQVYATLRSRAAPEGS